MANFDFTGNSADKINGPARCHTGRFIQVEYTDM